MLAKLICWAQDRNAAIERMKRALSEYIIVGVQTNIPFHLQLLDDPRFVAGEVHTGFLDSDFKMNPVEHNAGDDEIGLLVAAILSHGRRNGVSARSNGAAPAVNGWSEAGRQRAVTGSTFSQQQGQRWRRSTG
jgi:acetyl/propionyl-CoA carboxylase alpha subunit